MLITMQEQLMNCIKRIFRYTDSEAVDTIGVQSGNTIIGESKTDLTIFRILNAPTVMNIVKEATQIVPEEFEESDSLLSDNDIDLAAEAIPLDMYDDSIALSDFILLESEAKIGCFSEDEKKRANETLEKLQGSELLNNFLKEKNKASCLISDMLNEIDNEHLDKTEELTDMSAFLKTK